jgi:Zn ribbon nucleic-acid-binding protein
MSAVLNPFVCAKCQSERLQTVDKPSVKFVWECVNCGHTQPKKCPCYWDRERCRGCQYVTVCGTSKLKQKGHVQEVY